MKHRSNGREDSARINIFVLYSFNEPPFLKGSGRPRHLLIMSSRNMTAVANNND
jgi:hypothetical protein